VSTLPEDQGRLPDDTALLEQGVGMFEARARSFETT